MKYEGDSKRGRAVIEGALSGQSVIDWPRAFFEKREDVDRFLRTNLYDPGSREDMERLGTIHRTAVDYIIGNFDFKLLKEITSPGDIHDIFLYSSIPGRGDLLQHQACMVLKVMNIVNHLEARELLYQSRVSMREVFQLIDERVRWMIDEMRQSSVPIKNFFGGMKSKDGMISKLLGKKESIAARIFDRLRYRIIFGEKGDILEGIRIMMENYLPFNYIVPGQSYNDLMKGDILKGYGFKGGIVGRILKQGYTGSSKNPFSGETYSVVNFVVDLPVKLAGMEGPLEGARSRIVFGLVEFQLVDSETGIINERGENSYENYKRRQRVAILRRLLWGM